MKLNKKGMTLVELIVSIGLLSIIMAFLFKIILDVKYEKDLSGFADQNQINRAEIIKLVQDDFLTLGVDSYQMTGENRITFNYGVSSKTLSVSDSGTLLYGTRKWTVKDKDYHFGSIQVSNIGDQYLKIVIPVVSAIESDTPIDDIELLAKYNN